MDGVYFDNTFPSPSTNLLNGTAYIDAKGRLRPGYTVMAFRDFLKRLRAMLRSFGPAPVLKAHTTDTPIPGYLGFCDFWMDGECGGYPDSRKRDPDFVDRWHNPAGLTNLRITLGRQWGTMPQYLYNWGLDATHAVLGLFDLPNAGLRMNGVDYDFGLHEADCRYRPYWDVKHPAKVTRGGPDVLTAVWERPGRLRLLVSNLSEEDRTVDIAVDTSQLDLPADMAAVDAQSGEAISFVDGSIRDLPVHSHNYRVALLAAPGVFPPAPVLSAELLPKTRIDSLCDDFSTLDEAWIRAKTPALKIGGKELGAWRKLHNGQLRFFGGKGSVMHIRRPFGEDNCSVQVRIGTRGTSLGTHAALVLYWDQGRYVRFIAGLPQGPKHHHCCRVETVGGKEPFRRASGQPVALGLVNWVQIRLRPASIEFHCTTDGRKWQHTGTQPRGGFEGAPAWLILGHGRGGPQPFLQNDGQCPARSGLWSVHSYFDDLVVGRL